MITKAPIRKFPNDIPGLDIQSTLEGTARKKWEDYEDQRLPKHLIRHDKEHLECTCGYKAESITDWSKHATENNKRI